MDAIFQPIKKSDTYQIKFFNYMYDLRYLIQFLDGRFNDLWLFPFPKENFVWSV